MEGFFIRKQIGFSLQGGNFDEKDIMEDVMKL